MSYETVEDGELATVLSADDAEAGKCALRRT